MNEAYIFELIKSLQERTDDLMGLINGIQATMLDLVTRRESDIKRLDSIEERLDKLEREGTMNRKIGVKPT